ncbi:MAG: WYL domain-containing protein, partial [Planctomycetaceae bacterium]|nr:WYL domain-containing protein [Planctomycetaceae bacterium]
NVERILAIKKTGEKYTIPSRFSLERYLKNAWHLIPEPVTDSKVVIRFSPMVAQNVAEVRWHKTQKIRKLADGSIEYHATVTGIHEIAWWILGYGKEAEVISPPELRAVIREHVREMSRIYV